MRSWRLFVALAAVVGLAYMAVLTGCSPAAKLVGTWEVDIPAAQEKLKGDPLALVAGPILSGLKLNLTFQGDGNCTVDGTFLGQSKTVKGSWRFVKEEGTTLLLMVKLENEASEREMKVVFVDNDHIEAIPPTGISPVGPALTFPFVRKKP
ncbi:hypothetical protein Psta_1529 [Pirellula staleyi DSM 6068]|uniref:Lipocalin-like domain-containing protein n=1 Tax=Pirellula staleyi (strain ATCC 27377 / DSM 6068 / ICPB 4128) TaxID=530564 RepID=D2QXL9_PIRSD|nr:hypothetical protein [Pirellula staleyi]ADB16204.1 hypothetical protein Psta_1529 [Pirellula staleyi DSM 6068]